MLHGEVLALGFENLELKVHVPLEVKLHMRRHRERHGDLLLGGRHADARRHDLVLLHGRLDHELPNANGHSVLIIDDGHAVGHLDVEAHRRLDDEPIVVHSRLGQVDLDHLVIASLNGVEGHLLRGEDGARAGQAREHERKHGTHRC